MSYTPWVVVLSIGAITGFAAGVHRMVGSESSCHHPHMEAFERRVANVCVEAAERHLASGHAQSETLGPARLPMEEGRSEPVSSSSTGPADTPHE